MLYYLYITSSWYKNIALRCNGFMSITMIYLGWALILSGVIFIIFGTVALFRFPDFYTKLHASSVIECAGAPLCFLGLACVQDDYISAFKLVFIVGLIFLLNPVSTNALGRASLLYKVDKNGRVK